jgi:hypothetical protein
LYVHEFGFWCRKPWGLTFTGKERERAFESNKISWKKCRDIGNLPI